MNETETVQEQYASFLVRLWRRAKPAAADSGDVWQGEVEHIQSGRRWAFGSSIELCEIVRGKWASDERSEAAGPSLTNSSQPPIDG